MLLSRTPWSTARMSRIWLFRHLWYIIFCCCCITSEGFWDIITSDMDESAESSLDDQKEQISCHLCISVSMQYTWPLSKSSVHLAQVWALSEGNIIRGLANYVITRTSRTSVGRPKQMLFYSHRFSYAGAISNFNGSFAVQHDFNSQSLQEWEVSVAEEHCETEVRGLCFLGLLNQWYACTALKPFSLPGAWNRFQKDQPHFSQEGCTWIFGWQSRDSRAWTKCRPGMIDHMYFAN